MAVYMMSRNNVAMSTTADLLTLISASSRRIKILEIKVIGMGTTSAAGSIGVYRSTGGTTGSGALTPTKAVTESPTPAFTNFTGWSAQPSLSGDPLVLLGPNQNGVIDRWLARFGQELEARNAEQFSIRPITGTHNVSIHVIVDEV